MFKQRSKFLTVVFSLLPGAGHMFMGFMKIGLSLMVSFFILVFLSSWLSVGPLMYIIPILIFYSFFDCINKSFASPEEFAQLEDHYIFSNSFGILKGRGRLIIGILSVIIGFELFIKSVINNYSVEGILPSRIYDAITATINAIPQFVIAFAIIAIGVYLIIGKKRSDDNNG